ncbi:hypothetical protein BU17DRAFT_60019 [Hysterangium stoloniferum]|nr:hypothetical protein BU17DRAFT_60019 [Hysterangium stoloniferum]
MSPRSINLKVVVDVTSISRYTYMGLEKQNIWYKDILMWSGKYLDIRCSLRGQEDKLPAVENKVCLDHLNFCFLPMYLAFTNSTPSFMSQTSPEDTQVDEEVHPEEGRSRLHPKRHQKIHIQVDEENASEESQEERDQEQDLELDCLEDQPPLQHVSAQLHSSKSIKRKEPPTVPEPPPKQYKTVKDVTLPKNANKLQKIVNLPGKTVVLHWPAATVASRITSGDRNQLFWFGGPKKVKASKPKPEKGHVTERYFQLLASMQH